MTARAGRLVTAALFLFSALLPSTAEAHQRLIRTEPARDAVAVAVPRELRLEFAEPVQLTFTQIAVVGEDGTPVAIGELRLATEASTILVVPLESPLRAGAYSVHWATASRDGHPVRGEYTFSIAEDAEGLDPGPPPAVEPAVGEEPREPLPPTDHRHPFEISAAGTFSADSPAYVAIRWVTYVALLGAIGAVAFSVLVAGWLARREGTAGEGWITDARHRAAGVGLFFAAVLALASAGRLYAQSLALHGPEAATDLARIGIMLRETIWGSGWILQVIATVAAGVGYGIARRGNRRGWLVAGLAAVVLAVTPALSGHAAAMTGTAGVVAIVTDSLHVLAAAGWLGSLLVLLLAGIPAALALGPDRRGPAVAAMVRAFSPTALLFAGVLVLTGVVAIVLHSESLRALVESRYGAILLVKLAIFAVVFATGAYNYRRVRPALGNDAGIDRLRRSAGVEVTVAAAVLLVTAVLVATARPYEEQSYESSNGNHSNGYAFASTELSSVFAATVHLDTQPGSEAVTPVAGPPAMADSAAVAAVVHRFHRALEEADSATVLQLLSEDAIVLENGEVESKAEYRSHHLASDIEFAMAVRRESSPVRVTVRGDVAWASSSSTVRGSFRGREVHAQGAELMVLVRTSEGWRISAIHWSSRAIR